MLFNLGLYVKMHIKCLEKQDLYARSQNRVGKSRLIGERLAIIVCNIAAMIVQFIL